MWSKSPSRNWNPLQNPGMSSAQKTRIYSSRFRWWSCSTCGWSIMPSCLPPIFLPSSPSTRCFFFYSEFRFLWSEYFSSALSILTPQNWLFWGPGPLLYRFKPFHSLEGPMICMVCNKSMFHLTRLVARCEIPSICFGGTWRGRLPPCANKQAISWQGRTFLRVLKLLFLLIEFHKTLPPIRLHPSSNCIRLRCNKEPIAGRCTVPTHLKFLLPNRTNLKGGKGSRPSNFLQLRNYFGRHISNSMLFHHQNFHA